MNFMLLCTLKHHKTVKHVRNLSEAPLLNFLNNISKLECCSFILNTIKSLLRVFNSPNIYQIHRVSSTQSREASLTPSAPGNYASSFRNPRNPMTSTSCVIIPESQTRRTSGNGFPKAQGQLNPVPVQPEDTKKVYEYFEHNQSIILRKKRHVTLLSQLADYRKKLPLIYNLLERIAFSYILYIKYNLILFVRGGEHTFNVLNEFNLFLIRALNTRNPRVICTVLKVLQELVTSAALVGEALVPYYRQILPTLNLFKHKNVNSGDEIDYSQQRRENLGDLIQETLEMLERHGGRDAYINIKYMVPTYQSCVMN
ncbi:unnamed protein product, partial [Meganyctiphanes norvegica]